MSCRYCGAALPPDALFCGECGRSVSGERSLRTVSRTPDRSAPVRSPSPVPAPEPMPDAPPVDSDERCPQCEAPIAAEDVFCRECGFVLRTASLTGRTDTIAVDEDETPPSGDASALASGVSSAADAPPASFPWGLDLAPRRPTGATTPRERFVLQFSTGESVTVSGTGLIGRNPVAQPGEFVDQFVVVVDVGKSVSKTHLEFGQEDGAFWVSDRFSTNGSVVRAPDAPPRRCEAGRRYFVVRGSRVDIGEQFFVVS